MSTKKLSRIALIAAIYAALTIALAPISYGMVQFRVSEALTLLPFIMPGSTIGLFIGCFFANILGGLGIIDIIFGSMATLIAGYLTSRMPNKWLAALPPVIVNALIIGGIWAYTAQMPIYLTVAYVGIGQLGACYILGIPLLKFIESNQVLRKFFADEDN